MKRIIGLFSMVALLVGCITQSVPPDPNILRVGVSPNSQPIIFKQGGIVSGIEADFANLLGKALDRKVVFVEVPWDKQIDSLEQNKTDIIMSGMSVTEARKVRMAFSSSYLTVGQMPLVRDEDIHKYPGLYSIRFCKGNVGTVEGTTGDYIVQRSFTKARRTPFSSSEKAVKALIEEKIDMFIYDAPVIIWLASENESEGLAPVRIFLTEEYLAWALRYEDTDLLQKTNEFLVSRRDSGELKSVIKKWMPYLF